MIDFYLRIITCVVKWLQKKDMKTVVAFSI